MRPHPTFGLVLIDMNKFKKSPSLSDSYSSRKSPALSSVLSGSEPNESLGELDKSFSGEDSKGCSAESFPERSFDHVLVNRKQSEKRVSTCKLEKAEVV